MDYGSHEETIDQHVTAAENDFHPEFSREARFQNDDAHLDPSRWWFASSAFPMIAGTLGPVASAFSICALGRQWRQYYPPGSNIDDAAFVPDPDWLTIVNAIQLALALVSNAFLLLNMTKRVRFTIAQPITIVGWYVSAICLLSLNATAAGPLKDGLPKPVNEYVLSQAFWYGVWAAILYFVVASLMAVTFWGALSGHYRKDFDLTPSQRTLMLQTIMFLLYLLLGALVFSNIEGWNYLDAVYWADVTLFTVGFGDISPNTALGRGLLVPYALIGIISLGLVISSIRTMILERGRRRLDARMEEKNRRRIIRTMTRKGKDEILIPLQREPTSDTMVTDLPPGELERRRYEFELMRKIQEKASSRRRWMAMALSAGSWLILWFVGAVIFQKCEQPYQNWTYYEAFYFSFVSLLTIGYGNLVPKSNAGKSFFVFWSLLALPTMTVLISNAGDTVVEFVRNATIHLGNITILPGEEGFTGNIKYVARQLTLGRAFKSTNDVLEDVERQQQPSEKSTPSTSKAKEEGGTTNGASSSIISDAQGQASRSGPSLLFPITTRRRRSLSRIRHKLDDLPTGNDLHLLLISEIQAVSKHMHKAQPRRYSFEEWAWYLGLIGEDERDPDSHRKAKSKETHKRKRKRKRTHRHRRGRRHPHHQEHEEEGEEGGGDHHDAQHETDVEDEQLKWSWVGHRSPLMGGQEESEWILERLMDRLKESLWMTKRDADGSVLETT
ncbi:Outward-rectifier potassium channel TOK1 [Tolypocladium capitatum]|uniref:Outward-rectifier potassium channel TOK1 n=1 Tax=Tolypocladium capitatum TaxID=45235 RepID=A0A2K3PT57_9HYPO|nr:Outward-rectifier potassium channel TOK1 [Tolypocladium capitatum]